MRCGKPTEYVQHIGNVEHSISVDRSSTLADKMLAKTNERTLDVEAESTSVAIACKTSTA